MREMLVEDSEGNIIRFGQGTESRKTHLNNLNLSNLQELGSTQDVGGDCKYGDQQTGKLKTDDKRPGIILIPCMAHARRKFSDAFENDKARAEKYLSMEAIREN